MSKSKGAPGPLSLFVPEPECRPGDQPDFGEMLIPEAGAVRMPPVDVEPLHIHDLAYSVIRVLNDKGDAVGPWARQLSDEDLVEGLRHMMTLRAFDARMFMAQRQGKTSFYMQALGEEAIACAFRRAMSNGRHEFPDLPPARAADRRRVFDRDDDEPVLLE